MPRRVYLGLIALGASLILGAVLFLNLGLEISGKYLTDDPSAIGQLPVYAGLLSLISIMIWGSCSAVSLLAALVLKQLAYQPKAVPFYLTASVISLFLGLDDAFRLHEQIIPDITGFSEEIIVLAYVCVITVFASVFWRIIRHTDLLLIGLSAFAFANAILVDATGSIGPLTGLIYPGIVEDGLKVIGLLCAFAYLLHSAQSQIIRAINLKASPAQSQAW